MIYTHAAAAVLALAAGFVAGWQVQGWRHGQAEAQQRELQATAREEAMHQALVETARRLTAQQEAARHAETIARRARADAVAADAVAGQLREYAADLAARADACSAAPATVGAAASAPGSVLAELLGRVESRGRELAAEADRRGVAGFECEQRYDALTTKEQP